jgi:hypothetical protein
LAFLNGIDQQNPITFPIDFELLTFNVFAAYLKNFKRTIKRKRAQVNSDDNQFVIETSTITIRLGAGSFNNACSALSHLFTECGVDKSATEVSITMWRKIALYLKGTRRTTARERQKQDPMPYPAYVHLAKALSTSDKPEHTAAHLFLLLEWNMVSCSEAVVDQHIDLFGVYNDALLVILGRQRGIKMVQSTPIILGISTRCLKSLPFVRYLPFLNIWLLIRMF